MPESAPGGPVPFVFGPVGGSQKTWLNKKDDDNSKMDDVNSEEDDDNSKKDGESSRMEGRGGVELYHPWMVESLVKKDDIMAKMEDTGSPSKLKMPGPVEEVSSGTKASGSQEKTAGNEKS